MKVILLQDVKKVGKKDQVVEVSIGYANNFLFPRKLAVAQTEKSSEILKDQQEDRRLQEEAKKQKALEVSKVLEGITLEFEGKVGKDGKMFGSISTKQVCEKMKALHNIELDKRKFVDKTQIDVIGFTKLKIELYKGVFGIVNVHVVEERKN